jgi:putative membrane protein
MHPVSPLLKAWPAAIAVMAWWFYTGGPSWLGGGGGVEGGEEIPVNVEWSIWIFLGLAVLAAVATSGVSYLMWRVHVYRISDDAIELNKGILFKQQRQARLDRLQAVDVVQPLVARIFGFAQVKVEVAGGQDSGVTLAFLRLGDAEALRNEIVALAAGRRTARAGGTDLAAAPSLSPQDINVLSSQPFATAIPADAQREVYAVPLGRLIHSVVRSWGTVVFVVAVPVVIVVIVLASREASLQQVLLGAVGGSIAGFIGALTGVGAYVIAKVNAAFNFKAAIAADGIRLQHGLFETRRQTVPPGRVQAVRFQQSLLWRSKDWWHVTINVAGYQETDQAVSTLLPVGDREEALRALHLVLPEVGDPELDGTVGTAMNGKGADGGFIASPRSAVWLDPWQWKRRGVRATETALLIRRGLFVKELFVVPHERTQSLRLAQGPVQRALGLANVTVQSTPGPVKPEAHHLAVADAMALLDSQAERARQRRKVQTPEQWAAAVGAAELLAAPGNDE